MEQTQTSSMKEKTIKVLKIVGQVFYYLLIVIILTFSIITIAAREVDKIPNLFGRGFLAVQTDSMSGPNKDSFDAGDLIYVKLLSDKGREKLEVGDVVTYFDKTIKALNTHRIVEINGTGDEMTVVTQGDKEGLGRDRERLADEMLAIYTGKTRGLGNFISFLNTRLGFGLVIVLPVLALFIFQSVRVYLLYKEKKTATEAIDIEAERERIRQEILEEMAEKEKKDK
ncbi:MAG: signal peptidase I [Acholeplasmataceae bacterium]|nr:signal peptidase I [Acholeplasmataceae bacterium]